MNLFKFKFYIEVLAISLGIVLIIAILPIQALVYGQVRWMSVFTGFLLWYTIIFHNYTFWELINKWFKR